MAGKKVCEAVRRLQARRQPPAKLVLVMVGLPATEAMVEEARVVNRITDGADRDRVAERHVDPTVRGPVLAARTRRRAGQLQISRRLVEARLVGEDADRPAKRSAAVKRALRDRKSTRLNSSH